MNRLVVLIVLLILIVGGLIFLSTRAKEVPTRTIEIEVNQDANAH